MADLVHITHDADLTAYTEVTDGATRNTTVPLYGAGDLQIAGSDEYASVEIAGGHNNLFFGFYADIPAITDMNQYDQASLASFRYDTWSTDYLSLDREASGIGGPDYILLSSGVAPGVIPTGRQWITIHIVCGSAVASGYEMYVGETQIISNFTQDWSGRSSIDNFTLRGNSHVTVRFDELTISDSGYPTEPTSGGYTLSCGAGSFALTGSSVSLKAGRKISAGAGSFALTGQPASLLAGRKLSAGPGSFALTGSAASLLAGRKISAGAVAFELTGQPASLLAGRKLSASPGSFTLTGYPADLVYTPIGGYTLQCGPGAFVLTGHPASIFAGRKLSASPGSFALTGYPVDLTYTPIGSYTLSCGAGSFVLTGYPVTFIRPGAAPDIVIPLSFSMGAPTVAISAPVTSVSLAMVPRQSIDIPFNIDLDG